MKRTTAEPPLVTLTGTLETNVSRSGQGNQRGRNDSISLGRRDRRPGFFGCQVPEILGGLRSPKAVMASIRALEGMMVALIVAT
jgi:hypothetical protein